MYLNITFNSIFNASKKKKNERKTIELVQLVFIALYADFVFFAFLLLSCFENVNVFRLNFLQVIFICICPMPEYKSIEYWMCAPTTSTTTAIIKSTVFHWNSNDFKCVNKTSHYSVHAAYAACAWIVCGKWIQSDFANNFGTF